MKKLTSDELLKILSEENDIKQFASDYTDELKNITFTEYLNVLLENNSCTKSEVIKASGLDRVYAYQIFNGTKSPSRDKVISLAFGFHTDVACCNRLLKLAGFSELYVRTKRDSCIIFALGKHYSIMTANELLSDLNEKILS